MSLRISRRHYLATLVCCSLALLFWMTACQPPDFTEDPGARLSYSHDTLTFDTVFTSVGSATRFITIRNPNDRSVLIDRISLREGAKSIFRLNVDGIPGNEQGQIEVPAHDSIYVFADVTVNPDLPVSVSPFIVGDALVVESNGNSDTVVIEAFGQNANYIPNNTNVGKFALLTQDAIWNDAKPYVIYGVLLVDSSTLTIPAGARVYVHGGLGKTGPGSYYNDGQIIILSQGKLRIEGTADNPVVIQGDRLEPQYADVYGQWGGIRLSPRSTGNSIRHAEIRNSFFGVYADSSSSLNIQQSSIHNSALTNLLCQHAFVSATNCLFYNAGGNAAIFTFGGNYKIDYCTFSGFQSAGEAVRFDNARTYVSGEDEILLVNALNIRFTNSILWGHKRDELLVLNGSTDPAMLNYALDRCIVQTDELVGTAKRFPDFYSFCNPCYEASVNDKLFVKPAESVYDLDSLSFAEGKARPLPGIDVDLKEFSRDPLTPDLGCLERKN